MSPGSVVRDAARLAVVLTIAGCSAGGLTGTSTPKGPTQGQVNSFASQLATAFSNGVQGTHPQRSPEALLYPTIVEGADGPHRMPFADGLPPGISRTLVNVSVTQRTNCTSGGYINVTGGMSGSVNDNGTGVLSLQVTETINSWQCIGGLTIDGDPYLSAAGTFSFVNGNLGTAASISFGGGWRWAGNGSGSCSVQMTALFNQDGSGHLSGQMCGYPVDATY